MGVGREEILILEKRTKERSKKMSDSQLSNNKTVKIPVLGKTKFGLYQFKVKSVTAIKGFAGALESEFESNLPAKESNVLRSSAEDKEKQKIKTMNLVALYYLTLSFKEEEHLDFTEDARTDTWPSGLACEIWKNLKNKFRPSDVLVEAELTKKLMGLTLENGS